MYLLDTNTVIYYLNAALPPAAMQLMHTVVDGGCYISVITKVELLGFSFSSLKEQQAVETFVAGVTVLGLDDDIVNATIATRRGHKIKLPDAFIAATTLVYDLTLLTRNTGDFKNITGLKTENPWDK
jgi:predicted nucleic acid-binding protein